MRIKLDTERKIIELEEAVGIKELLDFINKLPDCKEYKVAPYLHNYGSVNVPSVWDNSPLLINTPTYTYQYKDYNSVPFTYTTSGNGTITTTSSNHNLLSLKAEA